MSKEKALTNAGAFIYAQKALKTLFQVKSNRLLTKDTQGFTVI